MWSLTGLPELVLIWVSHSLNSKDWKPLYLSLLLPGVFTWRACMLLPLQGMLTFYFFALVKSWSVLDADYFYRAIKETRVTFVLGVQLWLKGQDVQPWEYSDPTKCIWRTKCAWDRKEAITAHSQWGPGCGRPFISLDEKWGYAFRDSLGWTQRLLWLLLFSFIWKPVWAVLEEGGLNTMCFKTVLISKCSGDHRDSMLFKLYIKFLICKAGLFRGTCYVL